MTEDQKKRCFEGIENKQKTQFDWMQHRMGERLVWRDTGTNHNVYFCHITLIMNYISYITYSVCQTSFS